MSADHIAEAQEVQDPERALELIQGVLREHIDVSTTIRKIHEVLDALPAHVGDVKADVAILLTSQSAQDAQRDTILRLLDEMRALLQTARDEAAAGHEIQKLRLQEEQEARKAAANDAAIAAKKREAEAAEHGAKWKERTAVIAAIVLGLAALGKDLIAFLGKGGS